MNWILALRPWAGIFYFFLVVMSFFYSDQEINWRVAITVFFLGGFAMVWNDYIDRVGDLKKGRFLVSRNKRLFSFYVFLVGALCLVLSWWVGMTNVSYGTLCLILLLAGGAYPFVQKISWFKNMFVGLTVGGVVIFPLLSSGPKSLWWVALLFVFVVSIREYVKDIEGMSADQGHKKTLALRFVNISNKLKDHAKVIKLALNCSVVLFIIIFGLI